ncbi:MAG: ABC transporter permease [Verrucomicrobiae bacterium]|nr:ABC transporter permease [Verrucomicrobiae bacterium]
MNDLKFAVRQLLKNPGFTAVAVLTLAIGIGASLAIFAVVDAILLRPLPLPESERLVTIYHEYAKSDMGRMGTSIPDLYDRRGKIEAFTSIGAYMSDSVVVGDAGAGRREEALRVSSDFLETVGVHPQMGQAFSEDQMTFQTHHVAILSNDYWKRQFDADPQVLGRRVRVNGFDKTIVAVLPAGFRFLSTQPQILLPLSSQVDHRGVERLHSNSDWGMIARLRDGATLAQAQAQMDALDAVIQPQFEWAKQVAEAGYRAMVVPLHADHVASIRPTLLLLQAGGCLLLLIAAVNLVNLLLVRASDRVKELGVRQSLGASRGHLLRQTLTESLMLSSAGGLAGLGLGAIGVRVLRVFGVEQLPLGLQVTLDGRGIVVAVVASMVFGAVVGLALTAFYLRSRLVDVLQAEGRGSTGSRGVQRLRHGFVAAQMALAFVLLVGAGLLSLSLKRTMEVSPGFQAERLLVGHLSLIHKNYLDGAVRQRFIERVVERVNALPGVSFAGLVSQTPVVGKGGASDSRVLSLLDQGGELITPYVYGIAGDYFRAMGIPLREGRYFDVAASSRDGRVCVVDEIFARRHWPDKGAVGQLIFDGPEVEPEEKPFTVIGVVGAVRQTDLTEPSKHGAVYFRLPEFPNGFDGLHLVARTAQSPERLGPTMVKALRDLEPEIPLNDVRAMESRIADTLVGRRSPALLARVFALTALLLAAVGTYGVLGVAVAQRRREIGLRMALGALPRQIGRQFLLLGLRLLAVGSAFGLLGAWLAGKAMQSQLFDVPPIHMATFGRTFLLLGAVALLACLLPALRASRVAPSEALRSE